MTRLDEIRERLEAGRPIRHSEVRDLLDQLAAMTARAEQAEKESRWIPVCDRLPEPGECLTAHADGTVYPASVIFPEDFKHCTYWMPLPEPPKKEDAHGREV